MTSVESGVWGEHFKPLLSVKRPINTELTACHSSKPRRDEESIYRQALELRFSQCTSSALCGMDSASRSFLAIQNDELEEPCLGGQFKRQLSVKRAINTELTVCHSSKPRRD
ncbi:hypothetical protein D8T32_12630 [Vibrio vulnificus]|nr:hypothetical protein [Vibrio vulnificus]RZQ26684.1 hypothetical protein D8T36_11380 [Vibrio vulnificus]